MAAINVMLCILVSLFGFGSSSVSRNVHTELWPGCNQNERCKSMKKTDLPNIVYTKAAALNHDILHFVFSTKEIPAVMMARTTGSDTEMEFDWDKIINQSSLYNAISFRPLAMLEYTSAIAFTKLIEYDDVGDDANLEEAEKQKQFQSTIRGFNKTLWMTQEMDEKAENTFTFNTTDDGFDPMESNNGSLSFKFHVPSGNGRESELPAQKYNANETVLTFILDRFTPSYNHSRFALEVIAVSSVEDKKMKIDTVSTIDDEYSPGVFLLTNLLTNPEDTSTSGFMQWKPVSYLGKSRGRKTSTKVEHGDLMKVDKHERDILNASILVGLFGDDLFGDIVDVKKFNISFGQPKDGFYLKNNYTVWTAGIGYGQPPKDEISLTVIIIISAGLGIPVLLIIFGGIFTIVRNVKKKNGSDYEPIRNDPTVQ